MSLFPGTGTKEVVQGQKRKANARRSEKIQRTAGLGSMTWKFQDPLQRRWSQNWGSWEHQGSAGRVGASHGGGEEDTGILVPAMSKYYTYWNTDWRTKLRALWKAEILLYADIISINDSFFFFFLHTLWRLPPALRKYHSHQDYPLPAVRAITKNKHLHTN